MKMKNINLCTFHLLLQGSSSLPVISAQRDFTTKLGLTG